MLQKSQNQNTIIKNKVHSFGFCCMAKTSKYGRFNQTFSRHPQSIKSKALLVLIQFNAQGLSQIKIDSILYGIKFIFSSILCKMTIVQPFVNQNGLLIILSCKILKK